MFMRTAAAAALSIALLTAASPSLAITSTVLPAQGHTATIFGSLSVDSLAFGPAGTGLDLDITSTQLPTSRSRVLFLDVVGPGGKPASLQDLAVSISLTNESTERPELRFSYASYTMGLELFDLQSGAPIFNETRAGSILPGQTVQLAYVQPQGALLSGALSIKGHLRFEPGNGVNPTPVSSCASISCMLPWQDQLKSGGLSFHASVSPVPEPSSVLLMLAGLGATGLIAHRRRSA